LFEISLEERPRVGGPRLDGDLDALGHTEPNFRRTPLPARRPQLARIVLAVGAALGPVAAVSVEVAAASAMLSLSAEAVLRIGRVQPGTAQDSL
jgi:hypothetical protein